MPEGDDRAIEAAIHLLRGLAQRPTPEAREAYVLDCPVAISDVCLRVGLSVSVVRPLLLELLPRFGFVIGERDGDVTLSSNPDRYPLGAGPLEGIWQALENGSISETRALELVSERRIAGILTPLYVKAVADKAYATMLEGDRQLAARRQRIVVEATSRVDRSTSFLPDAEIWRIRKTGGLFWVEIASTAVVDIPDGRIFHHALDTGQALLDEAKRSGSADDQGNILERLGVLHLDSYTVNRSARSYDAAMYLWKRQLHEALGAAAAAAIEKRWPMPEPRDALARADALLREAISLRNADQRAIARTALVECLYYRRHLYQEVSAEEVREQAQTALGELEGGNEYEKQAKLAAFLKSLDEPGDAANLAPRDTAPLTDWPYDRLLKDMGETRLMSYARFTAHNALRSDAAAGLALLNKIAPLLHRGPTREETERSALWTLQLRLIVQYLREPSAAGIDGLPDAFDASHAKGAEHLDASLGSSALDREIEGLKDLDAAVELIPALAQQYADAADHHRAVLMKNAGVTAWRADRLHDAVHWYTRSLPVLARLHFTTEMLDVLTRLQNLAETYAGDAIIDALDGIANALEAAAGEKAARLLQAIYTTLMTRWSLRGTPHTQVESGALFRLMRLAKGRRIASTLVGTPGYDWRSDPEALRRLALIGEARESVPAGDEPEAAQDLAALERRLMGPIGRHERREGMTARERFENLRHAFDQYLTSRFLSSTLEHIPGGPDPSRVRIDPVAGDLGIRDVQAALDAETVLLDLLVTDYGPTQQTVFALALTRDDVFATVAMLTIAGKAATHPDPDTPTALCDRVSSLRRALQAKPARGKVVAAAARTFLDAEPLLKDALDFLAAQQAKGKRHLCIVPHRELHYLPFHLLHARNRILADDWVITCLPNLHLLLRGSAAPVSAPRRQMVAVGGSSAAAGEALSELRIARASVTGVAELFDERPLLDAGAAEAAVRAGLEDTRFAYFHTHGVQCVYAPAFHRVFVGGGDGDDGAIHAYEILGLDLSRIELLGTAACETALGRFDIGDNLTGLPASFFQAGVRAMVGTLWNVHADTADVFFLNLFLELQQGQPARAAFAAAQRETRKAHPLYMDWGAFYFMGR